MSMSEYYNSRYPYVAEYNREEAADWADDYLETVYSGKGYTNKELVDLLNEADKIMKHLMAETNISKKEMYTSDTLYVVLVPHTEGKWLYYHSDDGLSICEYTHDNVRSANYLHERTCMMFTQDQINYYGLQEYEKEPAF